MDASAPSRLRAIARSDPQRTALVTKDEAWTYGELDRAVDGVATWLLRDRAAHGDRIVVLRFKQAMPIVVSVLALSRVGRVFAMLDPLAPTPRVEFVLSDLAPDGRRLLITDQPDDVMFPDMVRYDDVRAEPDEEILSEARELGPDDLQYISYTSGSTGTPMGLGRSGRQRLALGQVLRSSDLVNDGMRVGMVSAGTLGQAADLPMVVFAAGGTLVVHDVLLDGLVGIPAWLRDQRIGAVALVPTLLRFLLPLVRDELGEEWVFPELTRVALWGEQSDWSTMESLARHLPSEALLINAYGTTETGIITTLVLSQSEIRSGRQEAGGVPVGRLAKDVRVRIVDEAGNELADGERGELLVSSPQLSLGHWRRPDLTSSVVLRDGESTWWRTGDGAYLDADGFLHLTGRLDDIVKLNGHRVSLTEIERAARSQRGISTAAAVARENEIGTRLHLYVVGDGSPINLRWLRISLARSLPPAAIPDTIDVLDALPTLSNGKLNRRGLPEPVSHDASPEPAGTMVDDLARLFAATLGLPHVQPDDDFFALGGDSLAGGALVALLQTRLGHYVPTTILLEAPTPRLLSAVLQEGSTTLIVPVRTSGSGAPLFVIHGAGGDAWFAYQLAQAEDRPVYALQPPPLVGPEPFEPTLSAMAERYVAELRRVHPNGPYRLFGYSLGGVIAFEMATLLQADGAEVELLAFGDSRPPRPRPPREEAEAAARRARHAERNRQLVRLNVPYLVGLVSEHLSWRRERPLWRAFHEGSAPDPAIRDAAYMQTYGALFPVHTLRRRFRGDALLIKAEGGEPEPDNGWGPHVEGAIDVVSVPCGHFDLMRSPYVEMLGAILAGTPGSKRETSRETVGTSDHPGRGVILGPR